MAKQITSDRIKSNFDPIWSESDRIQRFFDPSDQIRIEFSDPKIIGCGFGCSNIWFESDPLTSLVMGLHSPLLLFLLIIFYSFIFFIGFSGVKWVVINADKISGPDRIWVEQNENLDKKFICDTRFFSIGQFGRGQTRVKIGFRQ